MYKAVIFDLDGTLLDTISDISDSVNAALKRMGFPTFTENEYKYFVGRGVNELIHTVIRKGNIDPEAFGPIKSEYLDEYAKRHAVKTRPYEGIIPLLKELKTSGIKIAILSNKPHFQTEEVVATYFKDIDFDVVFGKKPEYPIKPDPASARKVLDLLGMHPDEVLYVGDTNTDIETAINAGMKSVGVLWGFRTMHELIEAGAGYIVNQPKDILNIIRGDESDFES